MSRAIVAAAFGGPESLEFIDDEPGEPGPGEVLLEVRAAGVNPADAKSYSGLWGADPSALPMRLGYEAAGVVVAVGPDAIGPTGPVAVGDEVIAYRISGAYADRVVIPAATVVPRPATLTWEQAGGLLLAGATAVHALTTTGVGRGDTVLVHGASGGVGLMAVQLAKARGARVLGTASAARHDVLRDLGAEPVTYGDGLADRVRALAPDGVDAALDLVGTDEALDVSVNVVADRARIATIVAAQRGPELGIKVLGGADPGTEIRNAARLELVDLAGQRRLRVIVERSFPLDEAAQAHRQILGGHTHGKLVLVP